MCGTNSQMAALKAGRHPMGKSFVNAPKDVLPTNHFNHKMVYKLS